MSPSAVISLRVGLVFASGLHVGVIRVVCGSSETDSHVTGGRMSERNGEKSRFQINRKRAVLRRAKIRAMVAAGATSEKRPAHAKPKQKA